jgi:pimeloyl-ACP methyl ester carboxylesterase
MIRDNFVRYNNSVLHYAKAGNGEETLLVFHGFGQSHHIFETFADTLKEHYTLFVFDLYFHGNSSWSDGETPLSKAAWKNTIALFLEENRIDHFGVAGFSLGGKFALATLEAFPDRTKEVFLIAPDGIKTSFWYSLATYPFLLRRFFKSMILHHNRFLLLANQLNRLNLVDKGLIRFADFQMNTEEKRKRVYYSWVVFRHLKFNLRKLARLIISNNIKLMLIVGRYDKVIRPDNMKRFLSYLRKYSFNILEAGHTGLLEQAAICISNSKTKDENDSRH